ncbi:hypothetical protein D3C84_1175600 [compost metagenome]
MAGGEVVEADHALVELEQGFQQVGADEAGDAGDQPVFRGLREFLQQLFVAGHGARFCLCGQRRAGVGGRAGGPQSPRGRASYRGWELQA